MIIAIGSDHGGFNYKEIIKEELEKDGFSVKDMGTLDGASCDYPDIAKKVAEEITNNGADYGILICGTGIGMSIAANKIDGIRAAHVTDTFSARMTKEHNNANIICLGERITGIENAKEIVKAFLSATFQGGRHEIRVNKIMELEK